jgi:hypothetical protein
MQARRRYDKTLISTFRLYDRGSIVVSLRANLVLLSADLTVNIRNSKSIERVWIQGVESDPCEVGNLR